LNVGQEGIFFLQADSAKGFCRQIEYALPIDKSSLQFENARKAVAAMVKVFADPDRTIRADKARDRQFAAVALVARYRASHPAFGTAKHVSESIPADQSKRILDALAEMKWDDPPLDPEGVMTLPHAFRQLQPTDKDGWQEPKPNANEDADEVEGKAVAQWFKDHSAKYRIERLVAQGPDAK
jgi:hypothetical protein